MKNIVKILGIIAIVAMVGLTLSCETDPEDQTVITVSGFGATYEGLWGYIILSKTKAGGTDDLVAWAAAAKKIGGGSLTNYMNESDGAAYGDNDSLFILIGIGATAELAEGNAKTSPVFRSDNKVKITKGECGPFDIPSEFTGTAAE